MYKRMFDDSFKKMEIDLTLSRGSVKLVVDEFGINDSLLSKWTQRQVGSSPIGVNLTEDQKIIKKLQKELKKAQLERDILKKGGQHLFQGRREIFGFIKEHRKIFPIERMCKLLKVRQ